MNILYFLPGTEISGGAIVVFEHINRLRAKGHSVKLITFYETSEPINWYPLDITPNPFSDIDQLSKWADAIIATLYTTAYFVNDLKTDAAKYYLVQHDERLFVTDDAIKLSPAAQDSISLDEVKQGYIKYIEGSYRLPLQHITISSWLANMSKKEFGQKPIAIRNGINKDIFYPETTFPNPTKRLRVLVETTKQSIAWKGLDTAKEALESIDGIEVWTISADEPIWKGDMHFKSPTQDMIRKIYSSCDVLVKPSWYEGCGLGSMQAMACGCALVSSENFGVDDFGVSGQNCLTFPVKNAKILKKHIKSLVKNRNKLATLKKEGLATARGFGWGKWVDKLESNLKSHLPLYTGVVFGKPVKFYYRPKTYDKQVIEEGTDVYYSGFLPDHDLKIKSGDLVVDIGAHIGTFSLSAIHRGANVLAFEPNPYTRNVLEKNIALNKVSPNVIIYDCALGDTDGKVNLNVVGSNMGASSIYTNKLFANDEQVSVDLKTAESQLANTKIRMLKLDCEGAEYSIVYSLSKQTLGNIDYIAMEYHNTSAYEDMDESNTPEAMVAYLKENYGDVNWRKITQHTGYIFAHRND